MTLLKPALNCIDAVGSCEHTTVRSTCKICKPENAEKRAESHRASDRLYAARVRINRTADEHSQYLAARREALANESPEKREARLTRKKQTRNSEAEKAHDREKVPCHKCGRVLSRGTLRRRRRGHVCQPGGRVLIGAECECGVQRSLCKTHGGGGLCEAHGKKKDSCVTCFPAVCETCGLTFSKTSHRRHAKRHTTATQ